MKLSRTTENYLLAGLATVSLFTVVLISSPIHRWIGFVIRGCGLTAGVAFLVRCDRIPSRQQQHILSEREQLEQERAEFRQQQLAELESLERQIADAEARLEAEKQYAIQLLSDERSRLEEQYSFEREQYESIIATLQAQLVQLNAIRRPKGNSRIEWVANQIVDVFLEYEVLADFQDCHAVPGCDYVWLEPRPGVKVRKLKELSEEIQLRLALDNPPELSIIEGSIQVLMTLDKVQQGTVRSPKEIRAIAPLDLPQSVKVSNHYLICGDTGAGKSTFINNVACVAKQELGDDVDIIIIDPKFPDSEWIIDGVEILPQYKCFTRITIDEIEHFSAYDGIYDMAADVMNRLTKSAGEKLRRQQLSARRPTLYIVDEVPALIDQAGDEKKAVLEALLTAVRVGRSTQVKVILLGQSHKCTSYGFRTKDSLNNFSCYFLRELADKAADEWVLGREKKALIKQQIIQQQEESLIDPIKQFFCLYKMPGTPANLGLLPPPNAFSKKADNFPIAANNSLENENNYPALDKPATSQNQDYPAIEDMIEDAKILEKIAAIKATGEIRKTQIIAQVWDVKVGSRAYSKAREEYRRITGE